MFPMKLFRLAPCGCQLSQQWKVKRDMSLWRRGHAVSMPRVSQPSHQRCSAGSDDSQHMVLQRRPLEVVRWLQEVPTADGSSYDWIPHAPRQAKPLALDPNVRLIRVAMVMARIAILVLASSLRWRLLRHSVFVSSHTEQAWHLRGRCSMGKRSGKGRRERFQRTVPRFRPSGTSGGLDRAVESSSAVGVHCS